ncbi:hypothetical protein [Enterococcus raffinosus]
MSKRSLYSPEEKYQVISEVIDRRHSVKEAFPSTDDDKRWDS